MENWCKRERASWRFWWRTTLCLSPIHAIISHAGVQPKKHRSPRGRRPRSLPEIDDTRKVCLMCLTVRWNNWRPGFAFWLYAHVQPKVCIPWRRTVFCEWKLSITYTNRWCVQSSEQSSRVFRSRPGKSIDRNAGV